MKTLWIPLVALIVLVAASSASAGWVYTSTTGWTYVAPVYPAPTVYVPPPAPIYVYPPPAYTVPTVIATTPVIRPAPIVVRPRVVLPRRAFRRAVWTVW